MLNKVPEEAEPDAGDNWLEAYKDFIYTSLKPELKTTAFLEDLLNINYSRA